MSSLPGRFLFGVLVDSGTLLFGVLVERYGVSASGSVLPGPRRPREGPQCFRRPRECPPCCGMICVRSRRPREGPQGLVSACWELPNGDSRITSAASQLSFWVGRVHKPGPMFSQRQLPLGVVESLDAELRAVPAGQWFQDVSVAPLGVQVKVRRRRP